MGRGTVIGCNLCNKSSREISSLLNIPQPTVSGIITKWKRLGMTATQATSGDARSLELMTNHASPSGNLMDESGFGGLPREQLSGCIILGVSIYLKVSKDGNKITNDSLPGVDLMIAIGVIIMVLGFLGCCGAIRENRCMLLLFFISLLIIFILLLAAGILGAVGEEKVKDWVKESIDKFTPLSSQPDDVKADVEKLQQELKCCGLVNGPSDWQVIPDSCRCNATDTDCNSSKFYNTPCGTKIIEFMQTNMKIVLGIAFAIAILLVSTNSCHFPQENNVLNTVVEIQIQKE
ncbi:hypothetical protein L3Q82_009254 [Scortum barcoo]|uniref:Uncharacterized protein n=1 Tax=Scortum barcoo TaxID=214431 RepID=A0ACB8WGZ3_9TELE|nr:hypothetical protein L3Q82_009254 [Scortum barcoo]